MKYVYINLIYIFVFRYSPYSQATEFDVNSSFLADKLKEYIS
jgi:hypothetical protein